MCVCVCVCSLAQYMNTHIFWGAATAIFSQFADTKNFVALAALLMWIRIPFLPSPTTLSPCSCLPAWFITSIVLRGKCILRIAFHCCQHLFLQAGSFPFPCRSVFACPFFRYYPFYQPTYRPTTPIRTDCREVWSLFHHTHTHTQTCRAFSPSQMKLARGILGCCYTNILYVSTCRYV